jgi:hypothetical protein
MTEKLLPGLLLVDHDLRCTPTAALLAFGVPQNQSKKEKIQRQEQGARTVAMLVSISTPTLKGQGPTSQLDGCQKKKKEKRKQTYEPCDELISPPPVKGVRIRKVSLCLTYGPLCLMLLIMLDGRLLTGSEVGRTFV